jgi:hypothetical protein
MGRRQGEEWSWSCYRVCLGILHVERMVIHLPDLWNPLKSIKQESRSRSYWRKLRIYSQGMDSSPLVEVDPGQGGFRH